MFRQAHTVDEGEDCSPWNPDTSWLDNHSEDCGEVQQHPPFVCLYNLPRDASNGQYNLTEDVANEMPVYQNQGDQSIILAYNKEMGIWFLQSAEDPGANSGHACTTAGLDSAPWDADAKWEVSANGEWSDGDIKFMPEQVNLYGFGNEDCNGTFQITKEIVDDKLAYYNEGTEKWLCWVDEKSCWFIQSESTKGEASGTAQTTFGVHSAPWLKEATWMECIDDEWVDAENVTQEQIED